MKEYFVKRPKRSIEPEEIFLDAGASEKGGSYERLELPVRPIWNRLFTGLLLAMLGGLGALVFYYQTVRGEEFFEKAEDNRLRSIFEEAPRGIIVDRYGKVVAGNRMVFDVLVFSLDLPKDGGELKKLSSVLAKVLGLQEGFVMDTLKQIQSKNLAEPTALAKGIGREAALTLKSRESDLPGLKINGRYQRYYPFGAALAHVVGYTGRVSAEEIKESPEFKVNDFIGRHGLEASWDKALRGKLGEISYEVDARFQSLEERERIEARAGKKLELAIDAEFQSYFYQVMRSQMAAVGLSKGAGVALDPRTGEVLALVSLPSFDSNLFAKGISQIEFDNLMKSRSKPLFNRAVAGEYSPGSVIKPFVGLAALEERTVTASTKIVDDEGKIVIPNP
jgi:penicillin-binding protein 2